jgi:hypothetical protein
MEDNTSDIYTYIKNLSKPTILLISIFILVIIYSIYYGIKQIFLVIQSPSELPNNSQTNSPNNSQTNSPTLKPPTTPITLGVPFLNKFGYNFKKQINLQNQLIFDDSDKYFAEIFKAPETGIISGIVLKAKATPIIENPSFVISTRANAPEYQTTIIQNTLDNIILYCNILEFKQKYGIPDSVVTVNKDTPLFLLKNNIIYNGTLSNVQIDIYYS